MGLKVDANISFMFKEYPNFIDRYRAASEAGYYYTVYLLAIAIYIFKKNCNVNNISVTGDVIGTWYVLDRRENKTPGH